MSCDTFLGAVAFLGPGSSTGVPSPYGAGSEAIVLEDLSCIGNESTLFECPRRSRCDHEEDAGVMCQSNGEN